MKTLKYQSPEPAGVEDAVELNVIADRIKSRWAAVLVVAILTTLVGLLVMFFQPAKWNVYSSLYFPIKPVSLLAPQSASSALASGAVGLGGPNPLNVSQSFLQSQTVLDFVEQRVPRSRTWLEKKLDVRPDLTSSTLTVSVDDENVPLAQRIVKAYVDGLRQVSKRLEVSPMAADLSKLHAALEEHQRVLDASQRRLLAFQNNQTTPTKIVAAGSGESTSVLVLPGDWLEQARVSEVELQRLDALEEAERAKIQRMSQTPISLPTDIPVAQKWRDRLVEQEYQLKVALLTQPEESPNVQMLHSQIDLTRKQLGQEIGHYFAAVHLNVASPEFLDLMTKKVSTESQVKALRRLADSAPSQAAEYQRLLTQFATENSIVQKLTAQVAAAELSAQIDTYGWQILDDARVSDRPINKSVGKTIALWGALGIALGLCTAWLLIGIDARRKKGAMGP